MNRDLTTETGEIAADAATELRTIAANAATELRGYLDELRKAHQALHDFALAADIPCPLCR
jgi:hypothetical protein